MHRSPETDTVLKLQLDDSRCMKQSSHFYLNCMKVVYLNLLSIKCVALL